MPPFIRVGDLDEASIFFYRLWAISEIDEHPLALVILQPDYITIGDSWVLYASREPLTIEKINNLSEDTNKPVVSVAPSIPAGIPGMSLDQASIFGTAYQQQLVRTLLHSAMSLPETAVNRDRERGRWFTKSSGLFELWRSKHARLICQPKAGDSQNEFGYTWALTENSIYFFRSRTCKREGHLSCRGKFKLSEQKRETGGSYWNIDLVSESKKNVALLRLVPAGAGYKVFLRQLPKEFSIIEEFCI